MKIYLMTDLEGPAGVNRWIQTREGERPEKTAAMHLLTGEVNAAIEGILDVESDAQVFVWDGHGSGGGLIFDALHSHARVVLHGQGMGAPHHLDSTFDALFFVGQHAMAGTQDAPLCHTYLSRTVQYYKLNGVLVGEIGCLAAMAGTMSVPTVFLSGDDKACAEVKALIPNIITVETKKGLGIELALHLSVEASRKVIRVGAAQALKSVRHIPPLAIAPPYELEIRVQEGCTLDTYLEYGMKRIDAQTVIKRGDDLIAVFQ